MEIIGVLFIFILPLLAGYVVNTILRQKGTSQIETYLIGFFLLFFLQGGIFFLSLLQHTTFQSACNRWMVVAVGLAVLGVCCFVWKLIKGKEQKKSDIAESKGKRTKEEIIYFALMLVVFLLVILQIFLSVSYVREDAVLETVKTTLSTDTMYQYHPLNGKQMNLGMITSKKIITLPLYYAFWVKVTGIEANVLLYGVISSLTVIASYMAVIALAGTFIGKNKKNMHLFTLLYGVVVLSGGYMSKVSGYQLLYNGYGGDVICLLVMIPYLLYLIAKCTEYKNVFSTIIKIGICLGASLFMTGIGNGFMFVIIAVFLAGFCCILAKRKGAQ